MNPQVEQAACAHCGDPLDVARHARCDVCDGRAYCLGCARQHFCTEQCPLRGCLPGLCVRMVVDGVVAQGYGVSTSS